MTEHWQGLATDLADDLFASGDLTEPWRGAFVHVPRHVFVPHAPLELAYSSEAIVTQTRTAPVRGAGAIELPSSSASAPGAVALMLDRLKVTRGDRVLEVGTGTGYNAALLCYELGDNALSSVELDPALVYGAKQALQSLGYHPTLVAGDGYEGFPEAAPYDAIMATCAINHIPPAWIRQLAPNGRIVAPLAGANDTALMVLNKIADDEMEGRFDHARIAFMPLRHDVDNPLGPGRTLGLSALLMPHYGTTAVDPSLLIDLDDELALFLHLHIAGLVVGTTCNPREGHAVTVTDATSSAEVPTNATAPSTWQTLQRGPHRLWDTVEHATRLWQTLGAPRRSRYGITALTDTARQFVWLDEPLGPYSWPMPL